MMEIKRRQKRLTPEEKLRVVTDYNGGIAMPIIMVKYGIKSRKTIYNILNSVIKQNNEHDDKTN